MLDVHFPAMGSEVRVLLEAAPGATRSEEHAAAAVRRFVQRFEACLSRFRDDSDLAALNADPHETVPAAPLLRAGVAAALWAARRTGGLVDPTLAGALQRSGYARSRVGVPPVPLVDALAAAPVRRRARPHPAAVWRAVRVDDVAGTIVRPPGVRIDLGGTGKGLAADLASRLPAGVDRWAVDCGGDLRVGGRPGAEPHAVQIAHPLTGETVHTINLASGAVATSGIDVRVWRTEDGGYAHHLLDPSTGAPAWTGLIGATALGGTALEAETLAKAALLSGPDAGRRLLAGQGGVLVHDDGDAEIIVPPVRPVIRVPRSFLTPVTA